MPPLRILPPVAALPVLLALVQPAPAGPWQSRSSAEGMVDAIGLATATDGTPTTRFDGLVLLSVACTDDGGKPLKTPSVSFLAYSAAEKKPTSVTATLAVDGKSFTFAGRAYKDTPYYFEVRSVPRGALQAISGASEIKATVKPGELTSSFDMTDAKTVLAAELAKCRR